MNSAKQCMNSAKQCVNSKPMLDYCSRAEKKKKKKGRKRGRSKTLYANGHIVRAWESEKEKGDIFLCLSYT